MKWKDRDEMFIELAAKKVHETWMEEQIKHGSIGFRIIKCPSCGKEELRTFHGKTDIKLCYCGFSAKINYDIIPYEELDENKKEYNKSVVRTILKAMTDDDILSIINKKM